MVAQSLERSESSMATDEEIRVTLLRHWVDPGDQELVKQIYHEDVVLEFPQGNERIVGLANVQAMRGTYPAAVAMTARRVRGSGALWVAEMVLAYDGGTKRFMWESRGLLPPGAHRGSSRWSRTAARLADGYGG